MPDQQSNQLNPQTPSQNVFTPSFPSNPPTSSGADQIAQQVLQPQPVIQQVTQPAQPAQIAQPQMQPAPVQQVQQASAQPVQSVEQPGSQPAAQQIQPSTPTPVEIDPNSLRGIAAVRGFDASQFPDDQALAAHLLNTASEFSASQPFIDLGRKTAAEMGTGGAGAAGGEGAGKEGEGVGKGEGDDKGEGDKDTLPPELTWDIPAVDPQISKFVEQDQATGTWQPIGGAPQFAGYAKAMNDRDNAVAQRAERIVNEFPSLVKEASAREMATIRAEMGELKKEVEGHEAERVQSEQEGELDSFISQHEAKFFYHDATGNRLQDPRNPGQPYQTPWAESLVRHAGDFVQGGATNGEMIRGKALELVEAEERMGKFNGSLQQPQVLPQPRQQQVLQSVQPQPQAQSQQFQLPQRPVQQPAFTSTPGVMPMQPVQPLPQLQPLQQMQPIQPQFTQPAQSPVLPTQQPPSLIQAPQPTFLDEASSVAGWTPNFGNTIPTGPQSPTQSDIMSAEDIGMQICREAGDYVA